MTNNLSIADIDRLVRLVLEDLGRVPNREAVAVPPESKSADAAAGTAVAGEAVAGEAQKSAELAGEFEIRLTDRVISLSTIQKARELPSAKNARRVVVPQRSIVTPLVRDELKKRHLELVFELSDGAFSGPVIPAASASRFVPASERMASSGNLWMAFHLLPVETLPKSFFTELEKYGNVTRFHSACVVETAFAAARFLSETSGGKAIVLTTYPSVASAVLNRSRSVRALVGDEPNRFEAEAAQLGANVLVVDPKRTGFFAVGRMIRRFALMPVPECPAVLKRGLE